MKKLSVIITLSLFFLCANAQKEDKKGNTNFSVGLEAGLPVGIVRQSCSFVLGGTVQVEKHISNEAGLTLSTGYISYLGRTIDAGAFTNKTTDVGFVPLQAGAKYYFSENIFGHAQLGIAIGTSTGVGTYFSYAPGIGAKLTNQIDAELKYHSITSSTGSIGQIGVRIGYNF